jgi:hypothetical protein
LEVGLLTDLWVSILDRVDGSDAQGRIDAGFAADENNPPGVGAIVGVGVVGHHLLGSLRNGANKDV